MYSTSILLDNRRCLVADPNRVPAAARANAYWCPLGPLPGRAWVLVRGADVRGIAAGGPFHTLTFREEGPGGAELAFPGLVFVGSRRIAGGGVRDPEALHLAEFADRRLLAARFSDTGRVAIHLRSYAQSEEFLAGTGDYTWGSALAELWAPLAPLLGPFPGLPISPASAPPPLLHVGENAWSALARLLLTLGCTVRYDPLADRATIIALDSSSSTSAEPTRLLRDAETFRGAAAHIPATIRVYFPDHFRPYGQERDTELEEHWLVEHSGEPIEVPTGEPRAVLGSVLPLWDDLPRLFDEDHEVLNPTELSARANERAARWLAAARAHEPRCELQAGLANVVPGGEIRAVLWRAWGHGGGTATEWISRGGLPSRICGGRSLLTGIEWSDEHVGEESERSESRLPRRPDFPRLANVVEVWNSEGESLGAWVIANEDGLFPGRVRRWVAGELAVLEDCWIKLVDLPALPAAEHITRARHGERYVARLSGIETSGGEIRPLYLAHRGETPADACLCYAAHATSAQSYESPTTLPLDAEAEASNLFALAGGELLLKFNGPARFAFRVCGERGSGSGENISRAWLERQPDGGAFTELTTSFVFAAHPATGGQGSAVHPGEPLTVANGDRVRIRAERFAGADPLTTLANGVSLLVCPCPGAAVIGSTTRLIASFRPSASVGTETAELGSLTLEDHNLVQRGVGHVFPWAWDFQNTSPTEPAEVQYFSAPLAGLTDSPEGFTLSLWLNLDAAGQQNTVVSLGEPGELPVLEISRRGSSHPSEADELAADLQGESTSLTTLSAGTLPTGSWHLVFFRWNAATQTASLAVDDGAPFTASLGEPLAAPANLELRIGYSTTGSGGETDGRLDALRLWRRTLAEYERMEEWNGGDGRSW